MTVGVSSFSIGCNGSSSKTLSSWGTSSSVLSLFWRKFDLMFSGHAHGGQFRLPFVGGLYAPGQGILPKYTAGVHSEASKKLIINRGLGNSGFPLRLFNRPEIVTVTIE